jgi:hypothetical protein
VFPLLAHSVSEINVRDGYGVGPLGYAMMHLSRSRNDAVAQAVVNDLLFVRPNILRQGTGVMSPLVRRLPPKIRIVDDLKTCFCATKLLVPR